MVERLAQQLHVVAGRILDPVREASVKAPSRHRWQARRRSLTDQVVGEADRTADLDTEAPHDELSRCVADAVDLPLEQLGNLVEEERARPDRERGEQGSRLDAEGPQSLRDELRRI